MAGALPRADGHAALGSGRAHRVRALHERGVRGILPVDRRAPHLRRRRYGAGQIRGLGHLARGLGRLEVHSEGFRGLGAPNVEGVFRRVVGRLPVRIRRDVVDVAEVLGQAVPRIADVVQAVRADDVPAEAPAVLVALVEQAAGAHADLVHVADFEARVVEARPVRLDVAEDVVVAAALHAHEGDDVLRAVRELQADDARIEVDHLLHLRCEPQSVAEARRPHLDVALRMAGHAGAVQVARVVDFPLRDGAPLRGFRDAHVHEQPVGVAEPDAFARRFLRWVHEPDARLREPLLQALELIGLRPETHMVHVLLLAFDQDHLVLIAALAAHDDALVELAGFHAEIGVELRAERRIRHGKSDVLQRTNRHGPPPNWHYVSRQLYRLAGNITRRTSPSTTPRPDRASWRLPWPPPIDAAFRAPR